VTSLGITYGNLCDIVRQFLQKYELGRAYGNWWDIFTKNYRNVCDIFRKELWKYVKVIRRRI
jgi:hypothetical protein